MKKLSLFLTIILLSIIGISTMVKAGLLEEKTQDSDSVILADMDKDDKDGDYEDYEDEYDEDEDEDDNEDENDNE